MVAAVLAIVAFGVVVGAAVAAVPYLLGMLYGCFPPEGSCGDGVGWAMIISAPITIPLTVVIAAVCATVTYLRVARPGPSNRDTTQE